jgi:uncharacterized membrane protein YeaQ/YmgE (transglycosylase-associated protein family)
MTFGMPSRQSLKRCYPSFQATRAACHAGMDAPRQIPYDQATATFAKDTDMGIISMIIVGFIVGLIARAVMPGEQKLGFIMTTLLGIVGSIVAGYLGAALGFYHAGQGAGWLGSIIGAIIVLLIYGKLASK